MASMNNWLGFSLSPQEIPSQDHHHHHHHHHHHSQTSTTHVPRFGFNSEELSAATHDDDHHMSPAGECFDLTSHEDSTLPSLNLPAPFAILEAFNRTNQSHDWDVKDLNMNSSINPMVVMANSSLSSCNNNLNHSQENQEPKLENFLDGGNFFTDNKVHHQQAAAASTGGCNNNIYMTNNNNITTTIGLSMIKNWLRNNHPPGSGGSGSSIPLSMENKNKNIDNSNNNNNEVNAVLPSNSATAQNLSLSMSTGSQSTSALPLLTASSTSDFNGGESFSTSEAKPSPSSSSMVLDTQSGGSGGLGGGSGGGGAIEAVPRKSIDTFGQRTSIYRGVTRHRWTGRYEAHLWDNSCRREGQTRKGRQVYLGGYDKEEKAARAYDLAALKYWGTTTTTNFPISNYEKELEEMKHMTRQEYVASLRRKSSGFSRGASIYRGVTRHHQHGRWQARIGRVAGNKDLYLGTFSTQEEAAEAYDIAAIKFRGLNAVTNFEISRYDVKSILDSSTLPIGGSAKRLKDSDHHQQVAVADHEMSLFEMAQRSNLDHHHHHHHHLLTDLSYGSGCWPSSLALIQQQSADQPVPLAAAMNKNHYQYPSYDQHHQQQQRLLWCKQEHEDHHNSNHDQVVVSHNSFQDIQTIGGSNNNTHNFLQQPSSSSASSSSVLHNLMSLDSCSIEHSSGSNSNSVIYNINNGSAGGYHNFQLPMATTTATAAAHEQHEHHHQQGNDDHENLFSITHYQSDPRYYYYYHHQQQSSSSNNINGDAVKGTTGGGMFDHQGSSSSSYNNWVPTAIPTRSSNLNNNNNNVVAAVCHGAAAAGASTFTVWNE